MKKTEGKRGKGEETRKKRKNLGGVFGGVGRPWGHHGSQEAVLDALRPTRPGARAASWAKKDPRWDPKWDPKRTQIEHENEDETRCS